MSRDQQLYKALAKLLTVYAFGIVIGVPLVLFLSCLYWLGVSLPLALSLFWAGSLLWLASLDRSDLWHEESHK